MALYVSISIQPYLESMISFIILNEHSTIGPIKILRQGRTKLLKTGYLLVLNTLFHQIFNLSVSSGKGSSESVMYFCISVENSPQTFDKKVSKYGLNLKGFHVLEMIIIVLDLKHRMISEEDCLLCISF